MNKINLLKKIILGYPGRRTSRKIVVFESDDWGSIRMPSRAIYEKLLKKGFRVDKLPYNRYDSLASETDLTALFDVLHSVKDKYGKPAILTANTIVANPDFEKIKETEFQQYHYEPFTTTLKRYPEHAGSFNLWKEGISAGIFKPQFHGREHLNVNRWMQALRNNNINVRLAFEYQMYDLSTSLKISDDSFMEALNYETKNEIDLQKEYIKEGLTLFEQLFGFKSQTFIAPCYIWNNELNATLKDSGVLAFQGGRYQFEPMAGSEHRFKKRFHYMGQENKLKQLYITRNVSFEPFENPEIDWLSEAMESINVAFRMKKPAVISIHRANFIGFIDPSNRERNLLLFKKLLKSMLERWPEIEFLSTDQLLSIMRNEEFNS